MFDLSATPSPDSSVLVVREDGELSEIKELTIKEIPDDSIAFTLDFSSKKNSKENGALIFLNCRHTLTSLMAMG